MPYLLLFAIFVCNILSISVKYCTDCEDPEEEACPFCANLYQKKGLGNHKIHCRQRPLASGPRNGASDAPRGVDTATGAGAPAPHAAHFERLEAILERMLEQRAPRSVQREEHRPHGHIDVARRKSAQRTERRGQAIGESTGESTGARGKESSC